MLKKRLLPLTILVDIESGVTYLCEKGKNSMIH